LEWDGFVLPAESKQPRYVIGKSTASTLNFAAIMAQAARVYREYDKGYARNCQKRAESAWQWAHEHPKITEPEETGGTGAYGDNTFNDEFFWAACELFISTGKSCYKKYVVDALPINPPNAAAEWNMVKNLGYYSLCICKNKLPGSSKQSFREEIISLGDRLVSGIDSIPYRIPIQDFRWGSNAAILNHAIILCYAHRFSKGSKYLDGIIETIDYIFGKNATGYSFVTGFGALSPLHPHHRIMGSDANDLPIPGFLVGGPNSNRDDELREGVVYPFKEPAKSYVDNVDAYAVNEVCINWNAALAFVLGYLTAYWSNK
jgi:endoglucanase